MDWHRGNGPARRVCSAGIAVALLSVVGATAARAGSHAVAHYPSYYPDEIRIETIDPATAAKDFAGDSLHAYIGGTPAFAGAPPAQVKALTSIESLVVLNVDPAVPAYASAERRCAAASEARGRLAAAKADRFVFHPYPITPYHPDYLHHADRAIGARDAAMRAAPKASAVKIGARDDRAAAIVGRREDGDGIVLETVAIDALMADAAIRFDGWLGPPWSKEGWFQAYRLLAPADDDAARQAADDIYSRLLRGEVRDLADQANTERQLIAALTGECRRTVVGYTLRSEYVNDAFSAGAENIAADMQSGINGPIFVRTAKLKDFPWNGSLRLGLSGAAAAAWNPIGGFTDPAGRLIWSALSDPAMIPFPFNGSWIPNRVQSTVEASRGQSGGIPVPPDALRPEPGSGALRPLQSRVFATAKVAYETIGSPFLDGTAMDMADVLYPFVFGSRPTGEPAIDRSFAAIRERLVAVRPVRVEQKVQSIASGIDVVQKSPVVEVYLRDAPGDDHQIAALAPAWSTVPWHLLVLMEEAARRGYAAFTDAEARRRKIPWMDLVRDQALHDRLAALVREFARTRFRPDLLKDWIDAAEAERRWRALQAFAQKSGHFLVANGPYRLKTHGSGAVVLAAVRDAHYPLGFGTFDMFVHAPSAVIREATRQGNEIVVVADADIPVKVMRHYEVRREPLTHRTAQGTRGVLVSSRYLLIGPSGDIVRAGRMHWDKNDRFRIDLPESLPRGRHIAVAAIFLDGNARTPSIGIVPFQTGAEN